MRITLGDGIPVDENERRIGRVEFISHNCVYDWLSFMLVVVSFDSDGGSRPIVA